METSVAQVRLPTNDLTVTLLGLLADEPLKLQTTDNELTITIKESKENVGILEKGSLLYTSNFIRYPSGQDRKVLVIKLNALLKGNAMVGYGTIGALVKMLEKPPQIKKSNTEADFYRRLLHGITIDERDYEELSGGNSLQLGISHHAIMLTQSILTASEEAFAVSFEVLNGRINAFLECVHIEKNHAGQITCAKNIRELLTTTSSDGKLETSEMNTVRTKFHKRVQDSYSLRCVPQVHGVAYDLLRDVIETVEQELNMPQTTHLLLNQKSYPVFSSNEKLTQSMDFLAMGVHQIASMSIVRSQRILNDKINKLPMKIQEMPNFKTLEDLYWECSALFLQGKTLLAPLSGDSINGSTYTIDISYSANNLLDKVTTVWRNTNILIGFELLVSLRCLDELRKKMHPDKLTPKLEEKTNQARCPLFIDFDGVDEFEQILLAYQAG